MELMGYFWEVRKLKHGKWKNQGGLGQPDMGKLKEKGINLSAVCKYDWLVLLSASCACMFVMVQGVCTTLGCSLLCPGANNMREIGIHWSDWVSQVTGGSTFYTCVYILHRLSPCPAREGTWWAVGADCVWAECLWGVQIWMHLCINTCMFVCLSACREYILCLPGRGTSGVCL